MFAPVTGPLLQLSGAPGHLRSHRMAAFLRCFRAIMTAMFVRFTHFTSPDSTRSSHHVSHLARHCV